MSRLKRNRAGGVITLHAPLPDFLKSEESTAGALPSSEGRRQRAPHLWGPVSPDRAGQGDGPSPPENPLPLTARPWLSPTSLRRLQARIKMEKTQTKDKIQSLLDAKKELMEESEAFLSQWNGEDLKKKESRHKGWMEEVWLPRQKRVEDHVTLWGPVEVQRRLRLYSRFLHYCNVKGFVFLDIYDIGEYNPFLLEVKQPPDPKARAAEIQDQMYPRQRETMTETRVRECDCKQLGHDRPASESHTSHTRASLHRSASAAWKSATLLGAKGQKGSRFQDIPYHISVAGVEDGRCCRANCGFSRC
ncbi:protein FAM228A [Nelusetta ayraudi]|uniref:protein FAM228A n=1 Tax=Nelusetta ayraudi TaxID=303726 RepID=UPI003F728364